MHTTKTIYLASALLVLLLTSACGAKNTAVTDSGSPSAGAGQESSSTAQVPAAGGGQDNDAKDPSGEADQAETGSKDTAAGSSDQSAADSDAGKAILIIIDQTPKPTTGNNSFDFVINKLPEGYMLWEMQWVSAKNQINNTLQEAIEHGQNGEDGFYISGDGQFMGFFYPDALKGEEGQVKFVFTNDQGKTLTWQKTITLK